MHPFVRWLCACVIAFGFLAAGPVLASQQPATDPGAPFTGVYVLPDDGPQPLLDDLRAARLTIDLYVYLLSDEEVITELIRARRRGVEVRVMLDPVPYGGAGSELDVYQRLSAAGVDIRWTSGAFRFAHVKMLIVDGSALWVMTLNLTEAAFDRNREFAVVSNHPERLAQATAIFENDWHARSPTPPGPLVVSPETSRSALLGFIASAGQSIAIYAEVLTDPEIVDALAAAEARGVQVRLVMSEAPDESLRNEEPGFLARSGVEVHIVNDPYIHAKAILVDGAVAWLGSQNFTANSLDNNREVGTFVDDRAGLARLLAAFEADFTAGSQLEPAP